MSKNKSPVFHCGSRAPALYSYGLLFSIPAGILSLVNFYCWFPGEIFLQYVFRLSVRAGLKITRPFTRSCSATSGQMWTNLHQMQNHQHNITAGTIEKSQRYISGSTSFSGEGMAFSGCSQSRESGDPFALLLTCELAQEASACSHLAMARCRVSNLVRDRSARLAVGITDFFRTFSALFPGLASGWWFLASTVAMEPFGMSSAKAPPFYRLHPSG